MTPPSSSSRSAPSSPRTSDAAGRNRTIRLAGLVVVLAALVWQGHTWWSPVCQHFARRSIEQTDYANALRWLDRANWTRRADVEVEMLRARVYRKQGRMDLLGKAIARAHQLGAPTGRLNREQWLALAQSGQMAEAEPHYSELLLNPGEDGEEICRAFALGYTRIQRFGPAIRLLEAWMADWPDRAEPYLLRGRLRLVQQENSLAESDFRKALERDPDCAECRLELASVLKATNRPADAAAIYEECLTDPMVEIDAKVGLAGCLKTSGDFARAKTLLIEVLAKSPEHLGAMRELARTHLENGDFAEVVPLMEAALKRADYDDENHYLLAQALQSLGRRDEAASHFEFSRSAREAFQRLNVLQDQLRQNPKDVAALVAAGEILLKYAEPGEGVVRLLAAVDMDPTQQTARRLLADYYERRSAEDPTFVALSDEHRRWLKPETDTSTNAPDGPAPVTMP